MHLWDFCKILHVQTLIVHEFFALVYCTSIIFNLMFWYVILILMVNAMFAAV